jgi:hypothetical protein
MNLYTAPGDTVECTHPNAGYPDDSKHLAKYGITKGDRLTVARVNIEGYSSRVYFKGVGRGRVPFNTVHFDNVGDE